MAFYDTGVTGTGFPRLLAALHESGRRAAAIMRTEMGGCGVFAAAVGQRLHALGFSVWVIADGLGVYEWEGVRRTEQSTDEVRASVHPRTAQDWINAGVFLCHLLLQFDHRGTTWTYDMRKLTDEPLPFAELPGRYHRLTYQELLEITTSPLGVSKQFARQKVEEIHTLVVTLLSDKALGIAPPARCITAG